MSRAVVLLMLVSTAYARPHEAAPQSLVDVATAVRAQVSAALPAGLAVAEVSPAGAVSARSHVAVETNTTPKAGWSSVRVWVDGRARWAEVRLAVLRTVLVARRDLPPGEHVSADDVMLEARPVDINEGWESAGAIAGATTTIAILAGAVVRRSSVLAAPPVPRGASVRVIVQRPGLTVSISAILERAAHPGERVAARLINGQRVVSGTLVDADTVLIANGERP